MDALSGRRRVEKRKRSNIATTEGKCNDKIKEKKSAAPDPFLQHQGGNFRLLKNNNKNKKTYRCNLYCALNSCKQEWTNYKRAKAAAKKGVATRCTGLMIIPTYEGVESNPVFEGNHECGWKAPQLLQGEPDDRPTLELVQPSQCKGGLVSNEVRESVVKVLEHANIWGKLTGGGINRREYTKNLAGDADSLSAVKKAMEPYDATCPKEVWRTHPRQVWRNEDLRSPEVTVLATQLQASLRLHGRLQGPRATPTPNFNHRVPERVSILLPSDQV